MRLFQTYDKLFIIALAPSPLKPKLTASEVYDKSRCTGGDSVTPSQNCQPIIPCSWDQMLV